MTNSMLLTAWAVTIVRVAKKSLIWVIWGRGH